MSELAIIAAGTMIPLVGPAFTWLAKNAKKFWLSFKRWWGGPAAAKRVWDAYKTGRDEIIRGHQDNGIRLSMIQDLRSEFRMNYPAYEHLFN